nr:aldehyde dehydrogenase family protein [Sphingopyxis sp. PET50]
MTDFLASNRPLIGDTRPATTSLGTRDHVNPATGKVQAAVPIGGAAEIGAAATAAVTGQKAWQALGPERRRDCLLRLADLIETDASRLLTMAALECGTPLSSNSSGLALSWIRYYSRLGRQDRGQLQRTLRHRRHRLFAARAHRGDRRYHPVELAAGRHFDDRHPRNGRRATP